MESNRTIRSRAPHAYAHHGLRHYLADLDSEERSGTVEFRTPDELMTTGPSAVPVIVPAVNEPQVQFLERLRAQLCLTPILAVVDDLVGHQTCRAMRSGATSVLNLELPPERRTCLLESVLNVGPSVREASVHPAGARVEADRGPLSREQEALADLLSGTDTVAAIARRFFCSERSMYRRVRALYETLGVAGRSELRLARAGQRVA